MVAHGGRFPVKPQIYSFKQKLKDGHNALQKGGLQ